MNAGVYQHLNKQINSMMSINEAKTLKMNIHIYTDILNYMYIDKCEKWTESNRMYAEKGKMEERYILVKKNKSSNI